MSVIKDDKTNIDKIFDISILSQHQYNNFKRLLSDCLNHHKFPSITPDSKFVQVKHRIYASLLLVQRYIFVINLFTVADIQIFLLKNAIVFSCKFVFKIHMIYTIILIIFILFIS